MRPYSCVTVDTVKEGCLWGSEITHGGCSSLFSAAVKTTLTKRKFGEERFSLVYYSRFIVHTFRAVPVPGA